MALVSHGGSGRAINGQASGSAVRGSKIETGSRGDPVAR